MRHSCIILGTRVDVVSPSEAVDIITQMRRKEGQHYIVTPNPEILVHAAKDRRLRDIINSSSLSIPDGIGVFLAAFLQGIRMPGRVTGVDTAMRVCSIAGKEGWEVGIFGGREGSERFCETAPCKIRVWQEETGLFKDNPSLDMLFVALGAPKQEYWIRNNLANLPHVKIAMAVGGAFDMLSGRIARAPLWMRRAGFEWLWRWYKEPRRTRRIARAVVVFPIKVLIERKN